MKVESMSLSNGFVQVVVVTGNVTADDADLYADLRGIAPERVNDLIAPLRSAIGVFVADREHPQFGLTRVHLRSETDDFGVLLAGFLGSLGILAEVNHRAADGTETVILNSVNLRTKLQPEH
ncbi:hypothetical protein LZ318_11865 [Saccharopolyspora indica]|uniref:hypothetical protein n=1 Tax=Saccharopolyspora indica TaxID=1229659 RepID=UPI0022EB4B7B|nr:hypothetical protein [Saccharopolyspora indica]MDA3643792.1 hypothetical protein [Saccharopolyspora indica]